MNIERNILLKNLTTFKIGGLANYFCKIKSLEELKQAVSFAKQNELPIFILGGGSNVLISDYGFEGLVIKIELKDILIEEKEKFIFIIAGAGESWDKIVKLSVESELYGIENLSYIPGTVGGAAAGNIGAYGAEIKDTIESIEIFDTDTFETLVLNKDECGFNYRDSIFKKRKGKNYIITKVCFKLLKKERINLLYKDVKIYFENKNNLSPTLEEVRKAIGEIRNKKFPNLVKYGTAGSFFKNPVISSKVADNLKKKYPKIDIFEGKNGNKKISLAGLLDNIGLKGIRDGDVGTFENQPLVFVNYGNARAKEIKNFSEKIIQKIFNKIKIKIFVEIIFVGDFKK